ncbi:MULTISPECIES: TIGR02677 family protein [Cupriavidus]|uniref:TIGR02677 family protein n=3 Tax=Cupriavidus TaxID=106589 RepID=A0A375CP25_9BURK|nr:MULTISPECIES: TIGR02677 family protein [Cupriavidus]MCO4865601.1 TIGR02677 family protein [Cupriavidus sp. WGlv3]MCO4893321.1 TIGR02677 family protein [Cupriavidus sp. WGtm5]SOY75418.1 conserved hypothetical protein [Cupriavidus taiwanensis]SOY75419.1 conserved hypothetical protein [Cupriavidus taiwanensis]SOY75744.1 conserved hypothetical protein [Cupriavidus taiwanensis]
MADMASVAGASGAQSDVEPPATAGPSENGASPFRFDAHGTRSAFADARRGQLFSHVSADHATIYRAIMDVFAKAKAQYRLQLRPDEVLTEIALPAGIARPDIDQLTQHLDALVRWGNLEAQQDMARWSSIADFKRNYKIYRLSKPGEAVEAALQRYDEVLRQRAELQTVALADIEQLLRALVALTSSKELDADKVRSTLRELTGVFATMTENAAAFMAGVDRHLNPSDVEVNNVERYKKQLIDYLERFVSDLARRGDTISDLIQALDSHIESMLFAVAERLAPDAAPDAEQDAEQDAARRTWESTDAVLAIRRQWKDRWTGLRGWFVNSNNDPSTADLLRQKARSAIRQLAIAIKEINDRRTGRSDRSTDLRTLAAWFLSCDSETDAHRLARVAFGLNPARHLPLDTAQEEYVPPSTPWAEGPALRICPRLYQLGDGPQRGQLPGVKDRSADRRRIQQLMEDESNQVAEARRRFATALPMRLSELGALNTNEFALFLALLGEALDHQIGPDAPTDILTGDGSLLVRLEPLGADTHAEISTPSGTLAGRDHLITITPAWS